LRLSKEMMLQYGLNFAEFRKLYFSVAWLPSGKLIYSL
jgi:hypothetical protein